MKIDRLETTAKSSRVVVHDRTVYLSGLTPERSTDDVASQTQQVLGKVEHYLSLAGVDKTRLLTATVYVRDVENVPEVNRVWEAWTPTGSAPARTCISAVPARSDFALEVTVVAAK